MSLCVLSQKSVRYWSRHFGMEFVHGSAHHNHGLILITAEGDVWETDDERTMIEQSTIVTTTAAQIKSERQARSQT